MTSYLYIAFFSLSAVVITTFVVALIIHSSPDKSDHPQVIGVGFTKTLKPFLMYSSILQKRVRECCYLSARIKDLYCICGRGLLYPKSARH
jgi:hypothetical protein